MLKTGDVVPLTRLGGVLFSGFPSPFCHCSAKEALRHPGCLLAAIRYYRDTPSEIRPPSPTTTLPDVPLLYLHGANDNCIGLDVLEIARPFLPPRTEVVIVPGAGHFLQLETPEEFNGHVARFLDRWA